LVELNHNRPELRLKDNLRRELERLAPNIDPQSSNSSWPLSIRPIADNPKAINALSDFLRSLSDWVEDAERGASEFQISRPPDNVLKDFRRFLRQRISASSSHGLTCEDWLAESPTLQNSNSDFRPFLIIFRDAWK
jgi:hypothetical protein